MQESTIYDIRFDFFISAEYKQIKSNNSFGLPYHPVLSVPLITKYRQLNNLTLEPFGINRHYFLYFRNQILHSLSIALLEEKKTVIFYSIVQAGIYLTHLKGK